MSEPHDPTPPTNPGPASSSGDRGRPTTEQPAAFGSPERRRRRRGGGSDRPATGGPAAAATPTNSNSSRGGGRRRGSAGDGRAAAVEGRAAAVAGPEAAARGPSTSSRGDGGGRNRRAEGGSSSAAGRPTALPNRPAAGRSETEGRPRRGRGDSDERPRRERGPAGEPPRPPRSDADSQRQRPPSDGPDRQRGPLQTQQAPPRPPQSRLPPPREAPAEESERPLPPPPAQSLEQPDDSDDSVPSEPRLVRVLPAEPLLPERPVQYYNLCGVRLRSGGPPREFDSRGDHHAVGDWVMVDGERVPRLGQVVVATRRRHAMSVPRRVVRRARPDEISERERGSAAERAAERFCKERLHERKLHMKLVQTELVPGQKATFSFASEERVDFRELVRDLAQQLHVRIEMRQIGARDGAKIVGGIGSCGRELCCTTFLPAFQPVSIRMAKDQGMVLNPSKLAGQCGRLKCCLIYEHQTYKEMGKTLPKVGKRVQTPVGIGRVIDLDIMAQRVRVLVEDSGAQMFAASELAPIVASDGRQSSEPAEPIEPAESLGIPEG